MGLYSLRNVLCVSEAGYITSASLEITCPSKMALLPLPNPISQKTRPSRIRFIATSQHQADCIPIKRKLIVKSVNGPIRNRPLYLPANAVWLPLEQQKALYWPLNFGTASYAPVFT